MDDTIFFSIITQHGRVDANEKRAVTEIQEEARLCCVLHPRALDRGHSACVIFLCQIELKTGSKCDLLGKTSKRASKHQRIVTLIQLRPLCESIRECGRFPTVTGHLRIESKIYYYLLWSITQF